MTATPTAPAATPFVAPTLAPLAAVRDRRLEAAERAAQARESGYTDGYQAGLAAAAHEVDRAVREHNQAILRLATASEALETAAQNLRHRDEVALTQIENEVVALAVALATEIVGRELELTTEPVRDALARAAALKPERGTPIVRVHPDDAPIAREAIQVSPWESGTAIIADPKVERGGCVVDVGPCRVDAQLSAAIERMRAQMR